MPGYTDDPGDESVEYRRHGDELEGTVHAYFVVGALLACRPSWTISEVRGSGLCSCHHRTSQPGDESATGIGRVTRDHRVAE